MTIPHADDPIALFQTWFDEAKACAEIKDASAMTLATATADGIPNARVVLLKSVDQAGFVFYTNLSSTKGKELAENPHAALCFYWAPLDRQVRVQGAISSVTPTEADAYFASRPRESRLGAWASKQSQPYTERLELERRLAKYTAKYPIGDIPRPSFWSGFRLEPKRIEFWLSQPWRLHDRVQFTQTEDGWTRDRLYP